MKEGLQKIVVEGEREGTQGTKKGNE